jgi:PDZ domain-containing secreted protein
VSTSIGTFNLRNQVQAPFQLYRDLIFTPSAAAAEAGLSRGDTVLALNGLRFTGQALWQRVRWYAHPGDKITVAVRKQNRTTRIARILLEGYPKGWSVEDPAISTTLPDAVFVLTVVLVIPLFCLMLGVWVVFAPPWIRTRGSSSFF